MDTVTLPRSFRDTTPAEMMRDFTRRRQTSPHPPLVKDQRAQPKGYDSIASTSTSNRDGESSEPPQTGESREEEVHSSPRPKKRWLISRIWDAVNTWEREHVELVLENKQSVARDHLGICFFLSIP